MRVFSFFLATVALAPAELTAQVTCHSCSINFDPDPPMVMDQDCVTTSAGFFGACWEEITQYNEYGEVIADECEGEPSESCPAGGGGGGNGGPLNDDGGTGDCENGGFGVCPAYCHSCV